MPGSWSNALQGVDRRIVSDAGYHCLQVLAVASADTAGRLVEERNSHKDFSGRRISERSYGQMSTFGFAVGGLDIVHCLSSGIATGISACIISDHSLKDMGGEME